MVYNNRRVDQSIIYIGWFNAAITGHKPGFAN